MKSPDARRARLPEISPTQEGQANDGIGGLVRSLTDDATLLARQEIALAKREVKEGATSLAAGGGLVAAGAFLAAGGVLTLIVFLVIGLGLLLDDRYWLSSLIVAFAFLLVGGGLVFHGKRKLAGASLAPEETRDSIRETRSWAVNEAESLKRELSS